MAISFFPIAERAQSYNRVENVMTIQNVNKIQGAFANNNSSWLLGPDRAPDDPAIIKQTCRRSSATYLSSCAVRSWPIATLEDIVLKGMYMLRIETT